jgi:hypothetical protein
MSFSLFDLMAPHLPLLVYFGFGITFMLKADATIELVSCFFLSAKHGSAQSFSLLMCD